MSQLAIEFSVGLVSSSIIRPFTAPLEAWTAEKQLTAAGATFEPISFDRALYSRLAYPTFLTIGRYTATYISKYLLKDWHSLFPHYNARTDFGKFFLSKFASASLLFSYPFDLAWNLIIAQPSSYKSFSDVYSLKGLSGLYSGYWTSILGIFPYRLIYSAMYDFLHNFNPWVNDRGFVGLMARLGVSQFTAIAASLVCYPLDTIRKYQMVTGTSMRKAFRKIRKHAGIRGFYGGAMNNSVRTFLSALALIAYDQLKGRK